MIRNIMFNIVLTVNFFSASLVFQSIDFILITDVPNIASTIFHFLYKLCILYCTYIKQTIVLQINICS